MNWRRITPASDVASFVIGLGLIAFVIFWLAVVMLGLDEFKDISNLMLGLGGISVACWGAFYTRLKHGLEMRVQQQKEWELRKQLFESARKLAELASIPNGSNLIDEAECTRVFISSYYMFNSGVQEYVALILANVKKLNWNSFILHQNQGVSTAEIEKCKKALEERSTIRCWFENELTIPVKGGGELSLAPFDRKFYEYTGFCKK
jgi:hypothetical protein